RGVLARPPWRGPDPGPSASADPRGRGVRLSPGDGGPAPKLGQARGRGGRVAGRGPYRVRLQRAGRNGPTRGVVAPTRRRAAAARAGSPLLGPHGRGTGHFRGRAPGARAL